MKPRKVVLVAYRSYGIASSRLELISAIRDQGHAVDVLAMDDGTATAITGAGASFRPIGFHRGGLHPVDAVASTRMAVHLWKSHPSLIINFNLKPVLLGTIAAAAAPSSRVIGVVTGFGAAFNGTRLQKRLVRTGLRYAAQRSARIVFQNTDDRNFAVDEGLVPKEKAVVVLSSGVQTDRFTPRGASRHGAVRVALVSRLLWEKGVARFVEAARECAAHGAGIRFILGGEFDPAHPDAITESQIKQWEAEGAIEFLGYVQDMAELLREVDIFVLPTSYQEGVPRVILEASSAGVPVITTASPGCREVVEDGVTGYVLRADQSSELASRIMDLAGNPEKRRAMGVAGRRLMCNRFDRRVITGQMLELIDEVGGLRDRGG